MLEFAMPWTNLLLLYNGNINDRVFSTAKFEIRDLQIKHSAAKPDNFIWGQLKPSGGVFRWHYVVSLIAGRYYELHVTRLGMTSKRVKFRAPLNQSVSFSARKLGVW